MPCDSSRDAVFRLSTSEKICASAFSIFIDCLRFRQGSEVLEQSRQSRIFHQKRDVAPVPCDVTAAAEFVFRQSGAVEIAGIAVGQKVPGQFQACAVLFIFADNRRKGGADGFHKVACLPIAFFHFDEVLPCLAAYCLAWRPRSLFSTMASSLAISRLMRYSIQCLAPLGSCSTNLWSR